MKPKSSIRKVLSFIKMIKVSYRSIVWVLVIGGFIKATIPFLGLYFSAQILNALIGGNFNEAIVYVTILLLSQLAAGIIGKICDQRVELIRENCDSMIKQRIATKAYEIEYERFEKQETLDSLRKTDLSARGMGGTGDQIFDLYRLIEYGVSILYSLIFAVILFLQVDSSNKSFFNSYLSTIVLLAIYAVMILIYALSSKRVTQIFNDLSRHNDHVNSMFGYLVNLIADQKNAKDVRIYKMQDTFDIKLRKLEKEALHGFIVAASDTGRYYAMNAFMSQIASGISYVFIGAKAIYGVIPIGNVILYAGSINKVVNSIMLFTQILNQFLYRSDFLDNYTEFLETPCMSYDGSLPIEKRDDGNYIFAFHDVSFSYPNTETKILSHINLTFKPNETMAIVGQNGAGKTTLIKLLLRLYEPTSGYITLNGIDIRKYNYNEYTKAFSVVFQDFKLFSLELDENIAGGTEIDEEKLWNSIKEVDLERRVEKMDKGVKSRLYNNNGEGIDISGGEAQRFAIARALYKDAPFIILDEPTAALDPIAEAEIYENFNQMVVGKSAIYISHRMSSCKFCDRIVVLEKGMVSEEGNHNQLIEKKGLYAKLYETQANYYA